MNINQNHYLGAHTKKLIHVVDADQKMNGHLTDTVTYSCSCLLLRLLVDEDIQYYGW